MNLVAELKSLGAQCKEGGRAKDVIFKAVDVLENLEEFVKFHQKLKEQPVKTDQVPIKQRINSNV